MAEQRDDAAFWNPLDLLYHAHAAASPQSAWSILHAEVTRAGFGQNLYASGVPMLSTQPLLDKLKGGTLHGGGSFVTGVFAELTKRPELLANEPVAPHCKRSLTPFLWTRGELKAGERTALNLADDAGISAFVAFPLRNAEGSAYGNFTVYCTDPSYGSWLQHVRRLGPLLHISAQYLHDSLAAIVPPFRSELVLSPRQRECLLWASRGLSTKQIAARLGLSEPVVHEHVGAAKRKLGCATRSQAVARAVRLDLIVP
jgi:DNA-binding CsgD family transcriptional regulator